MKLCLMSEMANSYGFCQKTKTKKKNQSDADLYLHFKPTHVILRERNYYFAEKQQQLGSKQLTIVLVPIFSFTLVIL